MVRDGTGTGYIGMDGAQSDGDEESFYHNDTFIAP